MKLIIVAMVFAAITGGAYAKGYHYHAPKAPKYHAPKLYAAPTHVRGYIKRDGAYVMPHTRTAPNATKSDNWSSKPNINPYTGKQGTKDPYAPKCCGG